MGLRTCQQFSVVLYRLRQSDVQRHSRFPAEPSAGAGDVGAALFGVVFGERFELQFALRAGLGNDRLSQFEDRPFVGG